MSEQKYTKDIVKFVKVYICFFVIYKIILFILNITKKYLYDRNIFDYFECTKSMLLNLLENILLYFVLEHFILFTYKIHVCLTMQTFYVTTDLRIDHIIMETT
jgi:hypothetical protein